MRMLPLSLNRNAAENRKRKIDKCKEEQDDEYHRPCSSTFLPKASPIPVRSNQANITEIDLYAAWQAVHRRPFFQNIAYTSCWDNPKPLRSYFVRLRVSRLEWNTPTISFYRPCTAILYGFFTFQPVICDISDARLSKPLSLSRYRSQAQPGNSKRVCPPDGSTDNWRILNSSGWHSV